MGKKAELTITDSLSALKGLAKKQPTLQKEKRINCLISIKTNKFDTREALASYYGIHIRTLERWINKYKSGGISEMIQDVPKNKTSKIISPAIHQALEQRINDPNNPFLGYWDAQNFVEQEFNVIVKYQRIREYLIQHFKTKPKTPRKSHYKKDEQDEQAEKAFLKTTQYAKQH